MQKIYEFMEDIKIAKDCFFINPEFCRLYKEKLQMLVEENKALLAAFEANTPSPFPSIDSPDCI